MHEELFSPEGFLNMMVDTHNTRFNEDFWKIFDKHIIKKLPENPNIADLGTGPGLFLKDLDKKIKGAKFLGYDASTTMIEYANNLSFSEENEATFIQKDICKERLDLSNMDLISANFLLHGIEYPVPILSSILKGIKERGGIFMIYDWIRTPINIYFNYLDNLPKKMDEKIKFYLFPLHNKYSVEDLKWLLESNGFKILHIEKVNSCHQVVISTI
jgi:2-polyprenyl-3-methyl-5-hydroxy-6-metoxy-1,4-benzoquinol methylase